MVSRFVLIPSRLADIIVKRTWCKAKFDKGLFQRDVLILDTHISCHTVLGASKSACVETAQRSGVRLVRCDRGLCLRSGADFTSHRGIS